MLSSARLDTRTPLAGLGNNKLMIISIVLLPIWPTPIDIHSRILTLLLLRVLPCIAFGPMLQELLLESRRRLRLIRETDGALSFIALVEDGLLTTARRLV